MGKKENIITMIAYAIIGIPFIGIFIGLFGMLGELGRHSEWRKMSMAYIIADKPIPPFDSWVHIFLPIFLICLGLSGLICLLVFKFPDVLESILDKIMVEKEE